GHESIGAQAEGRPARLRGVRQTRPLVVADELDSQPQARSSLTLTLRTARVHELGPLEVETAAALLRAPS
ncbi:MAG: hypothetical protein JWN04_1191, partial [Myxococcaceae bacterium]|nr:hypothetical protein [Myxococcaceae bacterium]